MDVISDHSQAPDRQKPEPQFDHRIRWGNVALALAALVAIVAAVGLPRGNADQSARHSTAPVTELVTDSVPSPPTGAAPEPRRHRSHRKHAKRKQRGRKPAKPARTERSIPVAPRPTPTPAPAVPAPDQTPAAEREFGL